MNIVVCTHRLLWRGRRKYPAARLAVFVTALAVVLFSVPMLVPGVPPADDLGYHLSRIAAMTDSLRRGRFWTWVYPEYFSGYGYPNGLFYPQVFLYLPALLHLDGMGLIASYKVLLLACTCGAACAMLFCAWSVSRSPYAAAVSAVLYVLSSYRAVDVYRRAALGEVLAFVFLPLIVLGVYHVFFGDWKKWYWLSAGFTGCLFSHLITSVLAAGIVLALAVCLCVRLLKEPRRLAALLSAGGVCVLLTLFFTLPLLEQLRGDTFAMSAAQPFLPYQRTVALLKCILAFPLFSDQKIWLSSGIGLVFVLLLALRLKIRPQRTAAARFMDVCAWAGVFSILMCTEFFPWKEFNRVVAFVQFPFRFFLFATVFLSVACGMVALYACKTPRRRQTVLLLVLAGSFCAYGVNTAVSYSAMLKHHMVTQNTAYTAGMRDYLPASANVATAEARGQRVTSNHALEMSLTRDGGTLRAVFSGNGVNDTYLDLPLFYYKGYRAVYSRGNTTETLAVRESESGMVRVALGGRSGGTVTVTYTGTPAAHAAGWVSAGAWVCALGALVLRYARKKGKRVAKPMPVGEM